MTAYICTYKIDWIEFQILLSERRHKEKMAHKCFISLTHRDTPIAEALRDAIRDLFGEFLEVQFSTSKELSGGIRAGEDWFEWIVRQVKECDFALILITPSSVHKPWILWEAGAVAGAALASETKDLRKVRPLIYQVPTDLIPSPIRDSKVQFVRGDQEDEVERLLSGIVDDYRQDPGLSADRLTKFGKKIEETMKIYLEKIQASLLNAPAVASHAVLEEWRLRLDGLMKQNRSSEVTQFHDWMDIAFGRSDDDRPLPLDLRIHTRLAELYLKARKFERAIEQLYLAMQLAPRDIYVLRNLGQAYLDKGNQEKAKETIDRIAKLDKRAFERNAECAALLGRLHRKSGEPSKAADVYAKARAIEENEKSYYLANLQGEVLAEIGKTWEAEEAFKQSLKIIGDLEEENEWTNASAANAAFFLGNDAEAAKYLEAASKFGIDNETLSTIKRGLRDIAKHVGGGEARLRTLLPHLNP